MKNKIIKNILKTIIVLPIAFIFVIPIMFIFSDFTFKETIKDVLKELYD